MTPLDDGVAHLQCLSQFFRGEVPETTQRRKNNYLYSILFTNDPKMSLKMVVLILMKRRTWRLVVGFVTRVTAHGVW